MRAFLTQVFFICIVCWWLVYHKKENNAFNCTFTCHLKNDRRAFLLLHFEDEVAISIEFGINWSTYEEHAVCMPGSIAINWIASSNNQTVDCFALKSKKMNFYA